MKTKHAVVMKLLKLANENTLKAKDSRGKTPLHYAVRYNFCTDNRIEIIEAILERDEEAVAEQKASSGRSPDTFLDLKSNVGRSVYQEHLATSEKFRKAVEASEKKRIQLEQTIPVDESNDGYEVVSFKSEQEAGRSLNDFTEPRDTQDLRGPELGNGVDDRERNGEQAPSAHVQKYATGSPNGDQAYDTPVKQAGISKVQEINDAEKKAQKKKEAVNNKLKLLAKNSEVVLRTLKLHYMRTRDIQRAVSWLYGTNPQGKLKATSISQKIRFVFDKADILQDIQIFFDYKDLPVDISGDLFKKTFMNMQLDKVLKYVRFTDVTVHRRPTPRDRGKKPEAEPGRRDTVFFFDWFHMKGVQRILKLTVEENGDAVHSDEAIRTALDKVIVEHLDWQKIDSK